jgi:protein-tyrosine phosphatase
MGTSTSSAADALDPPLRVDWIDSDHLGDGRTGRLGLTFLPGKHGPSFRYPGRVYRRELDRDIGSLVGAGVGYLALLVEDHELQRWGDPAIVERAAAEGLTVVRWPMPDGSTPGDVAEMDAILAAIAAARERTDVAIACMGGVGRTGTVAACALVAAGWDPAAAIAEVRRVRHPTAVETAEQEAFVDAFARHRGSGRRTTS